MAKGIFVHRADSIYDDLPWSKYQFPKRYLKRAKNFENDWILYYEPRGGGGRMGYNAVAKVASIIEDPSAHDMYLAIIEPSSYIELDTFVPYKAEDGYLETDLNKEDGSLNQGLIQWAIRPISEADFHRIIARGFSAEDNFLPREDRNSFEPGFSESPEPFLHEENRTRISETLNRLVRDRIFRKKVLNAYGSRCALTGFKFINGGGRAEVEAAHIRPVAKQGPDAVQNGIALSGTVHWMFDRGLISLSDDYDILVSRQVNNVDEVWRLMNPDKRARLPANPHSRPHPEYLNWHRQNCFKQ